MPPNPSLQAWVKMSEPSSSKWSLYCRPWSAGEQLRQLGLTLFERLFPQVFAGQFEQVECIQKHQLRICSRTQHGEVRRAVLASDTSLPVDYDGGDSERAYSGHHRRNFSVQSWPRFVKIRIRAGSR